MRFCFYFEYKNIVGGVTSLLITLIKELHKRKIETVLYNYKDGLIARELKKDNVSIDIVDIGLLTAEEVGTHARPTDVFVITAFKEPFSVFFKANPRIIYYNINDRLTKISSYKFGISLEFLSRKLITQLIYKDSLILMDDTDVINAEKRLNLKIKNPKYLPIPITLPNSNKYSDSLEMHDKKLKLTYIGRSVNWKLYPLKKVLDDLFGLKSIPINGVAVSIVVDSKTDLEKMIPFSNYKHERIEVTVIEKLPPSQLSAFLLENSDLNFGMGTTALDSAKLGIPTILMDYSFKEFPSQYKYNWLYNTINFNLGRDISDEYQAPSGAFELGELIESFSEESVRIKQSASSYEYAKKHDVVSVVDDLLIHAEKTSFRMKSAKPYVLYYSAVHTLTKKGIKAGRRLFKK